MSRMLAETAVAKLRHSFVATNITTAAWVEVIAALAQPCSAVEIYNSSGSIIKLALAAAAAEDANEVPYYVLPNGSSILLPMSWSKGARLAARAVDASATSGDLIFNFFG